MEGPDPSGAVTKTKETTEWKDADTRVFTMYAPDGTTPMMRISVQAKEVSPSLARPTPRRARDLPFRRPSESPTAGPGRAAGPRARDPCS